jgi:hypothetical protein
MCFNDTDGHKYYLCEYPSDGPCEQNAGITGTSNHRNAYTDYTGDIHSHFYSYLAAYFEATPNTSVAIFHTSDGMPSVSLAFGQTPVVVVCPTPNDGNSKCTQAIPPFEDWYVGKCELPIDKSTSSCYKQPLAHRLLGWPGIQRSSINIFQHQSSPLFAFVKLYAPISPNLTINQNLLQTLFFSQCYNLNNSSQKVSGSGSYYCQYSGSLANTVPPLLPLKDVNSSTTLTIGDATPPQVISAILGKVCGPPTIVPNVAPGVNDSFGHC